MLFPGRQDRLTAQSDHFLHSDPGVAICNAVTVRPRTLVIVVKARGTLANFPESRSQCNDELLARPRGKLQLSMQPSELEVQLPLVKGPSARNLT